MYEVINVFLKGMSQILHFRGGCGLPSQKWHVCKYAMQQWHEQQAEERK